MRGLRFDIATPADAEEIAALRNAASQDLDHRFARRSDRCTAKGVSWHMRLGEILIARQKDRIVASLVLLGKKPWAIDVSYFTPAPSVLYLISMNVAPNLQRRGIGSKLLAHATGHARSRGIAALRLDAHDAPHGAGGFYTKCGWIPRGRAVFRTSPLLYFEFLLDAAPASHPQS